MKFLLLSLMLCFSLSNFAQVGIGVAVPHPSAELDVTSTNKGFLPPRVALKSTTDLTTIASPASGLLVYNNAISGDITPGYYYYNGSSWIRLSIISKLDDLIDVKKEGSNFTQSILIGSKTTGVLNSATDNVGMGFSVFKSLTNGISNTSVGSFALENLTTGYQNTSIGRASLFSNVSGFQNTAIGNAALAFNVNSYSNTAVGSETLYSNTGSYNTAVGTKALHSNTTGTYNTALGYNASVSSSVLQNATAIGANAQVSQSNSIQLGSGTVEWVRTSGKFTCDSYYTNSDERLKTNYKNIDGGVNIVLKLQPYSYEKKSTINSDEYKQKELGFKAQDIQMLLPELVSEGADPDKTLSVNYTALIPLLTKAIQEQEQRIVDLEHKLFETSNGKRKSKNKKTRPNVQD